jgi:bacteriocin-like protein
MTTHEKNQTTQETTVTATELSEQELETVTGGIIIVSGKTAFSFGQSFLLPAVQFNPF